MKERVANGGMVNQRQKRLLQYLVGRSPLKLFLLYLIKCNIYGTVTKVPEVMVMEE